jgi:RNA polymerase sigma factor (sigma-70 family)
VENTQQSLLFQAQQGDASAWQHLARIYRPLILTWQRRQGLADADAEDLTQEVLLAVLKNLSGFSHSGQPGAFRSWLKTIAINRTRDAWRARAARHTATGDSAVMEQLQRLEDPDNELSRAWDREHDRYVIHSLLDLMQLEFETSTLTAFRRLMLDGNSVDQVGQDLGMSAGAVYMAKSRVLKRLREVAEGLIDL